MERVKATIRTTLESLAQAHPGETLVGYALCTDDDLSSLLFRAITAEAMAASNVEDVLWQPTEWPYNDGDDAFASLSEELFAAAGSARNQRTHVSKNYRCLVDSLGECRSEGVFGEEVFLSALSTDPSEYMERMEDRWAARINAAQVAAERKKWIDKWD